MKIPAIFQNRKKIKYSWMSMISVAAAWIYVGVTHADIYTWQDSEGVIHFSNNDVPKEADMYMKEPPPAPPMIENRKNRIIEQEKIDVEAIRREAKAEARLEETNRKLDQALEKVDELTEKISQNQTQSADALADAAQQIADAAERQAEATSYNNYPSRVKEKVVVYHQPYVQKRVVVHHEPKHHRYKKRHLNHRALYYSGSGKQQHYKNDKPSWSELYQKSVMRRLAKHRANK